MHPADCPGWKYEDLPQRDVLKQRVAVELADIGHQHLRFNDVVADSRGSHGRLFQGLTPANCDYYAGHYRGESYRCLQFYKVTIPADQRVGAPPQAVAYTMSELNARISAGLMALDQNVLLPPKDKLQYVIMLACCAFVEFLTIHPYANGNGHAGRLILWCILMKYGYWPRRWTIEPRPADPPYSNLIKDYRDGNRAPLETFVLQALAS